MGKSTSLLCNLAGVYSEVAAYEFTTLTTVPGVIRYKGAKIQMWPGFIIFLSHSPFPPSSLLSQLLDLPCIIEGAKDGKGCGRQVIAVARTCSLIYMVLDVLKPLGHKRLLEKELEGFGIRYWWYFLKLKIPFRLRPIYHSKRRTKEASMALCLKASLSLSLSLSPKQVPSITTEATLRGTMFSLMPHPHDHTPSPSGHQQTQYSLH